MKPHQWKDIGALATGMTPANGFAWPSNVAGNLGIPLDGPFRRPGALDRRIALSLLALTWAVVISGAIWHWDAFPVAAALAAAEVVIVLRAVITGRTLTYRAREMQFAYHAVRSAQDAIVKEVLAELDRRAQGEQPPPEPGRDTAPR